VKQRLCIQVRDAWGQDKMTGRGETRKGERTRREPGADESISCDWKLRRQQREEWEKDSGAMRTRMKKDERKKRKWWEFPPTRPPGGEACLGGRPHRRK